MELGYTEGFGVCVYISFAFSFLLCPDQFFTFVVLAAFFCFLFAFSIRTIYLRYRNY